MFVILTPHQIALDEYDNISEEKIAELRQKQIVSAIKEMQDRSNATQLREIRKLTSCKYSKFHLFDKN